MDEVFRNAEIERLRSSSANNPWKKWGPYLSELQWGTMREDYGISGLLSPRRLRFGDVRRQLQLRGPIWFPMNFMLLRALLQFYLYYGDDFKVECPTGSGAWKNLFEVVQELGNRLVSIFARDVGGRRPVFGDVQKFQRDPHWRDHLLFYEYFHGDSGAGLGASHQTGWTGLVARIIYINSFLEGERFLAGGKFSGVVRKSDQ